ncbi:hypothetical protein Taro_053851 [Colocasia esculenta]|uniref:Uncharacterized protein n=1 Tax=Colocasia esculenta TaxID=4460 RepID=A0A843XM85_COLES|nr:hypothetical protein [Colocasia esculenta]
MRVATGSTEIATDHDDRLCRDQIVTEGTIAAALVNAAYRAVAFTRSAPESDREKTLHWIAGQNLPYLTQDLKNSGKNLRDPSSPRILLLLASPPGPGTSWHELGPAMRGCYTSGASSASGASVRQYLAGSSSRRRNEEEERCREGEVSAQSGRGGGEMPPPPERLD